MPEVLVTGGCGFIGSHLVDALLSQGFKVRVMDNLSNGSLENLKCGQRDKLEIINGNLTDKFLLDSAVKGCETVFHLAAHANVQNSAKDTGIDLENNTLATHNLLEAMRRNQVDRLVFASSAAVYGESGLTVLDEDYGPLLPISLYGASKLAGEGLISAYSHLYGLKATMFRFANIVGSRRHSGVIYDFVSRLRQNPSSLLVLGDGSQALKLTGISGGIEIVSIADIPAGTGLGSSSTFTVGLLNALYAYQGRLLSAEELARQACRIEIDCLKEPIGKQDQYIAAYGGICYFRFEADEYVGVSPLPLKAELKANLNKSLLLFYTGSCRQAGSILAEQQSNTTRPSNFKNLTCLTGLAASCRECLLDHALPEDMGNILHKGWLAKKNLSSGISNPYIDQCYQSALSAGAYGGKLLGAGGGGFLLVCAPPKSHDSVRRALSDLPQVDFEFEPEGSKIIYVL